MEVRVNVNLLTFSIRLGSSSRYSAREQGEYLMKLAILCCMSYKVKQKYPFHCQNLEELVSDLQSRVEAQDKELAETKQKLKETVSNNNINQ